ncbi:MAG TPA: hypothetical protein VLN45_02370 [Ignavibacteriaceae bacterium]|nr:hypothetical protein [Ignavibacteriaceae bacterium]
MDQNQIIVIRTNLPTEKDLNSDSDKYLQSYLQDIVSVVEQYQPGKIVFDELTPLVGYNDINKLKEVYLQTCEAIEDLGVTSLFILGEPVSKQSKDIIDLLKENSTGLIQLRKKDSEGIFHTGEITITPNVGHTEGLFTTEYRIQPQKGLVTDFINQSPPAEIIKPAKKKNPDKYKLLSDIEIIPETYPVTSFYSENEFHLLLNNQIAYYKSTGQIFYLCSILLNEEENDGLLNINQLKNTVKLSADKKDKICITKDRIIVLIIDEDQKKVNNLIARIKNNLPGEDKEKLKKIIQSISIFTIQVDEKINNADDYLNLIFSDKIEEKL